MEHRYDIGKEERCCMECGTPIVYGRADKKFCSNECKNHFHNRLDHETRRKRQQVSDALESNYRILSQMLRLKITSAPLGEMLDMGFHPEHFTTRLKKGRRYRCGCYDIFYNLSENKLFDLHRE